MEAEKLQVKIFEGYARSVEKQVNEFLADGAYADIVDIKIEGTPEVLYAMVYYKCLEEDVDTETKK